MNLSKNTFLALVILLFAVAVNAPAQSVVINKYRVEPDTVELLVVQTNLDMRGMIVKDFSSSIANDNGGRYQFSQNSLWSSVPAGTLVVLRSDASAADTNVSDYTLDIGFTNATYFSNLGGDFNISTTDMVMIKAAGSGASGVTGSIHAFASGAKGTQFNNALPPKLFAASSTPAGTFAFATNPNSTLADFNGLSATGGANGLTFGVGNNATNAAFINSLRNSFMGEPTTNTTNLTFTNTGATSLNLQWTNGNGARRIVLARQGGAVDATPTDGTAYTPNAAFGAGAQIGTGNFVVSNGGDMGAFVTNLAPNTTYHFAVFEYNGTDATTDYLTVAPAINNTTTAAAFTISGRVASSSGSAGGGFVVMLTGDGAPITTTTRAGGNYSFTNATAGGDYTVTVVAPGFSVEPSSVRVTNLDAPRTIDFTVTPSVIISEFRFHGVDPDGDGALVGATNEFIELYNRTDAAIDMRGWVLDAGSDGTIHRFGNNSIIPARGHFLIVGASYEALSVESAADATFSSGINIPEDAGISLHNGANSYPGNLLDNIGCFYTDIGFGCGIADSFAPQPSATDASGADVEHSFVRLGDLSNRSRISFPGRNFALVSPSQTTLGNIQSTLGAPAPQGTRAATNVFGSTLRFSLADTDAGTTATSRFRRGRTADKTVNGTLVFQRTITNTGALPINFLRLRVTDITTLGRDPLQTRRESADVRVLSSTDNGNARGLTLEEPPAQPLGGGLNSSLIVNGINSQTPLAPSESITLEFRLSVAKAGRFRFAVMPEALTVALTSTNENLVMGNPSNAVTDINQPTNYLLDKPQFVASYHRDNGTPNWVSWHLDSTWIGTSGRSDDFAPDPTLPAGWYRVQPSDYSNSGYTRGHMSPSGDRTRSLADNRAVFLMTNMIPQTAANNNTTWNNLEVYCRELVAQGNELYIISGGAGNIGTIANGRVAVPNSTWKVIIVLPVGDGNDAARVTTGTRTIAVNVPNTNSVDANWRIYRTTVDDIEALTNFDFFSNVPQSVQSVIEATVDNQ
ncbi:MAG: DNA/RNA non-specific endonuclease [Pyrinomonadaceae bacterium MAG19_C2-C3]|nr:DNA/RNA non-specific endonuclease [Pyrinomonadaceae bacterium MAG19_C2-C3]